MKRSDLFMFYKVLWELVGVGCLGIAVITRGYENVLLPMAGIAVLWAILMKMEEGG